MLFKTVNGPSEAPGVVELGSSAVEEQGGCSDFGCF